MRPKGKIVRNCQILGDGIIKSLQQQTVRQNENYRKQKDQFPAGDVVPT